MDGVVQQESGVSKAVRCGACGTVERMVRWAPGMVCPKCGSEDFQPLVVVGDSVDYALADRTKGYALEDIRFGKMAQWAGLIAPTQYTAALKKQEGYLGGPRPVPPLGDILRANKGMTPEGITAVLIVRSRERPDGADEDFARRAVNGGHVTADQVAECTAMQERLAADKRDVPPLALLLYEKRYLQENEVQAVLLAQQRQGLGLIHSILAETEKQQAEPVLKRILGPPGTPFRRAKIALMLALPLILALLVGRHFFAGAGAVQVICENCGVRSLIDSSSAWPQKCPDCGKRAAYPAAICTKCAHIFMVTDPAAPGIRCPQCKSDKYKILYEGVEQEVMAGLPKKK